MLEIHCPYCGESRSEEEFSYAGEAHIRRPSDPAGLDDRAWGNYLYFRSNPRGAHRELWFHAAGCRRYLNVLRDTASYQISQTYRVGESPEDV